MHGANNLNRTVPGSASDRKASQGFNEGLVKACKKGYKVRNSSNSPDQNSEMLEEGKKKKKGLACRADSSVK